MKKILFSLILVGSMTAFSNPPINKYIKPVVLDILAENCSYTSQASAEAAYQSALTDTKRCHFVDETYSGSYAEVAYDHQGSGTPTGRFCYKIMGY